uniref:Mago-bind domain-containing protein n=1 Tax=Parastrongyloides trichosuri TaxID=131310 RepID=A0A0N5A5B0_PARTI
MVQQINTSNSDIKVPTQGNPVTELIPMNDENSFDMKKLNGNVTDCRITNVTTNLDFIERNISPVRDIINGAIPEAQQREINKIKFENDVNCTGLYTKGVATDSFFVPDDTKGPEGTTISCPSTLKTIYTKKGERIFKGGKRPKKRYGNAINFLPENVDNYFGDKPVSEVITLITEEEKCVELVEKPVKSKNKKKKNKQGKNEGNDKNKENVTVSKEESEKHLNKEEKSIIENECEFVSVDVSVNLNLNGKLTQNVTNTSPKKESSSVNVSTTLPVTMESSCVENDFMVVSKTKKRNLNNNVFNNDKKKLINENGSDNKKKNNERNNINNQKNKYNNKESVKKESMEKTPVVETKTIIKQSATIENAFEDEMKRSQDILSQNTWAHVARPKNNLTSNGNKKDGSSNHSGSSSVESEKKRISKESGRKSKTDEKIAPSVLNILAQHQNNKSNVPLPKNAGFLKVTTLNKQVIQIPLAQKINQRPIPLEPNSEHYEYVKFLQDAWSDSFKNTKSLTKMFAYQM